jgi:hypothetical protein
MLKVFGMVLILFLSIAPAIVSVNAYGPISIKPISIFCQSEVQPRCFGGIGVSGSP